jgi:hypothetical protein
VRGAEIALDSLLGWCRDAESERTRRCEIILPEGLTSMPLASLSTVEGSGVLVGDLEFGVRESIGVGGVTVVSGVASPALGGV